MRHWFVVPLIALAGCSGSEPTTNASNAVEKPQPAPVEMFGGVDLFKPVEASGSIPFKWKLLLAPGEITYTGAGSGDPAPEPWYPLAPMIAGNKASWPTHDSSGVKTLVTLTIAECRLHGETLPLTAEVDIGGHTLRGCAGAKPSATSKN